MEISNNDFPKGLYICFNLPNGVQKGSALVLVGRVRYPRLYQKR